MKKWFTDAQELIDDHEVNAIYVATPPASHATYAIMAMQAGKPVYIEKPLAANYDDCVRINRISEQTGVPCFVAYYRRYLPYFQRVKQIISDGTIGKLLNVQLSFVCPPRALDYQTQENLPWRLQSKISGGGYFYDLAPHQLDLLQDMFGVIVRAHGYSLSGSASWCFVGHESAREDRIEVIGDKGMVSFAVYDYSPIELHLSQGKQTISVPNPPYVQLPIIKSVIEDLQGIGICSSTCISATPTNWVMDRILRKL